MGFYERDYGRDSWGEGGTLRLGEALRGWSIVKWLLVLNFVVFVLCISPTLGDFFFTWGAVWPETLLRSLQVWRLITYQFLHWDAMHFLFNMIVLYFFGPILEHQWGSRTFLRFYLVSGAAGGLVYILLVLLHLLPAGPMAGASGALNAVLMAVAILYPNMLVFIYGLIPVRIVFLVGIMIILSLLRFATGQNAGGEAAHLTGLAAGALYVIYKPWFTRFRLSRKKQKWHRRLEEERQFEAEVDRILEKVNREGIHSLTAKEKQTLQEATRREQLARRF
ncbi:MAG TPA: rhomboid family intramembrane serine protease [Anaerohalosphaeraceae bacterium]|nr:rhomboid family intramembrane serine protease [Anaerohalosphaeraceae bacterium]HOL88613.1 rhomboid family intramembrane serine protease [Anaerohalosphaeraceae bacterium]HPP56240.1 rhomboid family intramembrane serine protease [Anaerohalosphaeraceae bacterium]